jgi:His/Glu/Gln/Arg/opine family amino acid ABC transporter permease subunit
LRNAGVVGEGVYAIAVRRDSPELLHAIDAALTEIVQSGELRAILARWSLWDDLQTQPSTAASAAAPPARTVGMTAGQLGLFLHAAGVTIVISTLAMVLAVAGGLLLSLARRYGPRAWSIAATTYIEIFRGTPVLLQLYVLYYGLAPILTLDAFTAAVIGLGMNYAAYEAELYRAGLQGVPVGQSEAALALGMSRRQALRRIVMPQAFRVALPGMANDFIALLKDSSLVSVITVVDLTKQMTITAVDVRGWMPVPVEPRHRWSSAWIGSSRSCRWSAEPRSRWRGATTWRSPRSPRVRRPGQVRCGRSSSPIWPPSSGPSAWPGTWPRSGTRPRHRTRVCRPRCDWWIYWPTAMASRHGIRTISPGTGTTTAMRARPRCWA